jgi:hypothetical protein
MSDTKAARKVLAAARVQEALDWIEKAQKQLERACEALSSVQGMAPAWKSVGKQEDEVRNTWYVVRKRAWLKRELLILDREPTEEELERLKE